MKVLLIISSLMFLMVGCKRNPVTTVEKKQVTVNVKGKPVVAEASLTHYQDGHSFFNLVGGGKNLLFIQISPIGVIKDFGGDERKLMYCVEKQAMLCRQQWACSILCVGGANMSCVLGWTVGCATGYSH